MESLKEYNYDISIIGAGISGLVCGCYLAKAGLKVLIVEKNTNPGGYCVSFRKEGYQFDACVHLLSSFRKEGKFYNILNNLGLFKRVKIIRHNPSDIIIAPDCNIKLFNNPDDTVKEFVKHFPLQKTQIEEFFHYVISTPAIALSKFRTQTLQDLLNSYFSDEFLKTILSVLILGFTGAPPNQISAVFAISVFREFIFFDSGYYPIGGMQSFSKGLADIFTDLGGKILLSGTVKKIQIEHNKAKGIVLDNKEGKAISSRYLVSACDVRKTFFELIGADNLDSNLVARIKALIPSYSSFQVYLGMKEGFVLPKELKTTIWVIDSKDIKTICSNLLRCENIHLAITSPSMKDAPPKKIAICLTTNAPFINSEYWENEEIRSSFENRLIKLASKAIPDLERNIYLKFNATPLTLHNWTYNYYGAAYGWAGTPQQFGNPDISAKTIIDNLYLAGHWSNMGSGIISVVNSGYNTASIILNRERMKIS